MRSRQLVLVAMAFSMLAGLLVAAPVSAQDLIIADEPIVQNPTWYSFDVGKVDDDPDSTVTISSKDNATRFQLFTADELDYWATPEEGDWFGEASHKEADDGDDEVAQGVVWSGNLVPGTYYVRRSGGTSVLGISGEAVSGLNPIKQEADASETTVVDSPEIVVVDEAVTNEDNEPVALTFGTWIENQDNAVQLLTFNVGRLEDELALVTITMNTAPFEGAGEFQVFDASDAPSAWDVPEEDDWLGTSNDTDKDDEYYLNNNKWSGELVAGSYVVRVEPQGAHQYRIGISGEAVTY